MRRALIRFLLVDGKVSIMITPQGEPPTEMMRFEISINSMLSALSDISDIVSRVLWERK